MLKYVSIEVFLVFFVVGVILGGLIGIFVMCCLIAGRDSDNQEDERIESNAQGYNRRSKH